MTASHGRARRAGRAWLLTALAASGLHAVTLTGADSARACHLPHHATAAAEATPAAAHIPSAAPGQHAEGGPTLTPTLTPASYVPPVAAAQVLTPRPTSATRPVVTVAADVPPVPAMPKVETWNTDHPHGIAPAPPGHFGTPATPIHCHVIPPTPAPMKPLSPPAALQVLPTPEPSTGLIGLALAAFAWRRRRRA